MIRRLDPALQAFRAEVRSFLREQLDPALWRGQRETTGLYPDPAIAIAWQQALRARGWLVPLWPTEWGGTGWSGLQRFIFEHECAQAGAPLVHPMGVRLLGPVVLRFGDEAQKARILPRILDSLDYWCQGFSEPGAGSDLAALTTRAERTPDGRHYRVDGAKLWTTHAQHANRMFALVRTERSARRQDGISFLLIDLDSPGVSFRPIATIGGDHEVNAVFFDQVRVPVETRIGAEGEGWACARYLLEFERGAGIFSPRLRAQLSRVAAQVAPLAQTAPTLLARFGDLVADLDAFEWLELRSLADLAPGASPGPIAPVLKLRASRLKQAIGRLGVDALGPRAIDWPRPEAEDDPGLGPAVLVPEYLNSRAATIFGGAAEIQLGLIARQLLGQGR